MFTGVYRLEPADMLSAWEPRTQRLRLPGPLPRRPGNRAELRIEIAGAQLLARVAGTVTAVHHGEDEGQDGFELAPDAESLRAVGMLLSAAKGEPMKFARRPPRYVVRLPATVSFPDARKVLATTESVSEGGCGLSWSGRPPEVGQALRVRLEGGPRPAENLGTVCWSSVAPNAALTGVQFVGTHAPQAWLALVATLARGGAPRA